MGFDTIFDAQYLENLKGKDVQEIQYFLAIVFYRTFKKTYTYILVINTTDIKRFVKQKITTVLSLT